MTGKATETTETTETTTDPGTGSETSEADTWKARAREWERKAKANTAAAEALAKLEDAQKSETQKLTDAAATARAEADAAKADALRWRVAAKHGISDDDAELFLTGTDEVTLTRQAERLAGVAAEKKKNGNAPRTEGRTPPTKAGDDPVRELARNLFGRTDPD